MANEITEKHADFSVAEVNDHCVRLAVFTGENDWHLQPESDEELHIDFENKETAIVQANDSLLVPIRTVNWCIEHSHAETVIRKGAEC
ncbi:cupin domain-containing protein [Bacillus nakamurai]|uniref:cupin domain-containing protein n=1 Tax=Bacillus nakamurai TaxID=1793963 RepID=UPI0020C45BBF|nr:cupin domain-containing protein [Bacillus nakamurai]MCP6683301.1 cupin domain-containing protein [Bacillus nakamurai]